MRERVIPIVLFSRNYTQSGTNRVEHGSGHKSVQEIATELEELLHREGLEAVMLHNLDATSTDPENLFTKEVPCMLVFARTVEPQPDADLAPPQP